MKCEIPPPSILKDEQVLGLAISRAIRVSKDERDALRRICILLDCWGVSIAPSDLGFLRQDS